MKEMTVTNRSDEGVGICMSNAKVKVIDVALIECDSAGLYLPNSTSENSVVATRCEFANTIFHYCIYYHRR